MKTKSWASILATTIVLSLLIACAGAPSAQAPAAATPTAKKIKVGLILPSPISDPAWSGPANEGLKAVQQQFGAEIGYAENVQPPEFEDSFRDFASRGFDLVIGHGDQFLEPALKVAPNFPKTWFALVSYPIPNPPKNLSMHTYNGAETGFLSGVISGSLTKKNKVAAIGGVDTPLTRAGLEKVPTGVQWVGSQAQVSLSWVGDWNDMAKGKETALAAIAQGADVVHAGANVASVGIIDAAKDKGVFAVGWASDTGMVAPDTVVTSVYWLHTKLIPHIAKLYIDGKLEAKGYYNTVKDGLIDIAPYRNFDSKLSKETKDKIAEAKKAIIDGKVVPEFKF
ncbi:MAG: BMP family protein [Chloroflexi bacterium]|nr:BMP family protein [Chloroflexota bacterium]